MTPGEAHPTAAGPATHYELFAGLRAAAVSFLVTGATALTLHGVPRLTPDIDLVVEPEAANRERLRRLLAAWGYGEADGTAPAPTSAGPLVRRFRHPAAALEQIDVVEPGPAAFAGLRNRAAVVALVDLDIPVLGAADLRALKGPAGPAPDPAGVAGLATLAALQAGEQGQGRAEDTAREQIRKFSRWSVAARLDWLLAAARLSKGLAPEAKPMTRGLVRRRGWYGR
jgi:CheY-like chemotaxis protein